MRTFVSKQGNLEQQKKLTCNLLPFLKTIGGLKAFLDLLFLKDQSNVALYRANVLARAFDFGAQV